MLKQRIITAIVLLAIVLAALLSPSVWPMLALLTIMAVCAFWEWLRLVKVSLSHSWGMSILALILLAILSRVLVDDIGQLKIIFHNLILVLACIFWLFVAPFLVKTAGIPTSWNKFSLVAIGVICLLACWYALAWVYVSLGPLALISLWALVWFADIFAYFTGRSLGKHKLAPRVSPGKTWEGAIGGVLAASLWMCASALWIPDSFGQLLQLKFNWYGLVLISIYMAAWSIIGDLFESILKRRANVKDSSNLLPGHGGVYDRIDAVLPVAPAAVLFLII